MAAVALITAGTLHIAGIPELQYELVAGEDLIAGEIVRLDTGGLAVNADASAAGTADAFGMAPKNVKAGYPVTVIRRGLVEGFDLDDLAYGAPVFLTDTDNTGEIGDAAGTVSVKIGRVVPAYGSSPGVAPDKLLLVEISA